MKTTKILLLMLLTLSFGIVPLLFLNSSISLPVQTTSATPDGLPLNISAWETNGTLICMASNQQQYQQICSDGAGGAIITWEDFRNATNANIYARRISAAGAVQWTADGVALCTASEPQQRPQICSDGAGGAIITWQDHRNKADWEIYAQRINAAGAVQWTVDGAAVCVHSADQEAPQLCSDGVGGAIITWQDYRNGSNYGIFAQRISGAGYTQWATFKTAICTAINDQISPQICSDGAGGAYITWWDYRNGAYSDIYAQRINSTGIIQWTTNGVAISTATGDQRYPDICSEMGCAIITWADTRSPSTLADIYAQRISSAGAVQWTANGVALCTAGGFQQLPQICSDGTGGAIITWDDDRTEAGYDIYTQRITSAGAVQWTANGVALCVLSNAQKNPQICSDGAAGAIITWEDLRSDAGDIYAQWITASGAIQWAANGLAISTMSNGQQNPQICSDGAGGAIITWKDARFYTDDDIFAQNVKTAGSSVPFPFYSVILVIGVLTTIFAVVRFKLQRINGKRQL
jgi:predicted lipoprotein with Yx(FWY)xxD motif